MNPYKRHRTVRPSFAADQSALESRVAIEHAENEGWPVARTEATILRRSEAMPGAATRMRITSMHAR
jgi:hypothetical protein